MTRIGPGGLNTIFLVGCISLLIFGFFGYLNFTNPYGTAPVGSVFSLQGYDHTPRANYTVIFVLDGMRADSFYSTPKPVIESYNDWANFTDFSCLTLLSVSRAGYGVIPSGANTSETGVISNEQSGLFPGDSLWNVTLRNGGTTAVVGSDAWFYLFEPWLNYSISFSTQKPGHSVTVTNITNGGAAVEDQYDDYRDSLVSLYAQNLVAQLRPTFLVVHFGQTDEAGHENGTASDSYFDALKNQDQYIGGVLEAYEMAGILDSTTVVITADHGQEDYPTGGQHGGTEVGALWIPLLIRGNGVTPGEYSSPRLQVSLAPTLAALMGWEIPSDASGTILFECLEQTESERATYNINLATIRLAQAIARCEKMGYSAAFEEDLLDAETALTTAEYVYMLGDYSESISTAVSSETMSRGILNAAKFAKTIEEVSVRVFILLAANGFLLAIILTRPSLRTLLASQKPDKRNTIVVLVALAFYFIVLELVRLGLFWQHSASNLAAYINDLFLRIFLISGIALVCSMAAIILFSKAVRSKSFAEGLKTLNMFRVALPIIYYCLLVAFIGINGTGLPWYVNDANLSLLYFFLILTGMASSVILALLSPIMRRIKI
ncbi:MAG: alkaline phosphatase family protein [Candidatus Thorarchaeota archaeon]